MHFSSCALIACVSNLSLHAQRFDAHPTYGSESDTHATCREINSHSLRLKDNKEEILCTMNFMPHKKSSPLVVVNCPSSIILTRESVTRGGERFGGWHQDGREASSTRVWLVLAHGGHGHGCQEQDGVRGMRQRHHGSVCTIRFPSPAGSQVLFC